MFFIPPDLRVFGSYTFSNKQPWVTVIAYADRKNFILIYFQPMSQAAQYICLTLV